MPSTSISSFTMPRLELLNTRILVFSSCSFTVSSSPISMPRPPSPLMEITWRSGNAAEAPMACGRALAMVPWCQEPNRRRLPLGVM